MNTIIRLILFLAFFLSLGLAAYKLYAKLNEEIMDSRTGWQLLGFTVLLIAANIFLFFGGLFLFFKAYEYLVVNE